MAAGLCRKAWRKILEYPGQCGFKAQGGFDNPGGQPHGVAAAREMPRECMVSTCALAETGVSRQEDEHRVRILGHGIQLRVQSSRDGVLPQRGEVFGRVAGERLLA